MIRFAVREISSKGIDIHQVVPKEGIGLTDEEIDLRSPLTIEAHLVRTGSVISADAYVAAEFGYLCARCLEEFSAHDERDYHFDFEIDPTQEHIDLGEEIRQELIMANPARVLCKDDCQGICPKCGANLNKEQCKCVK